MQPRLNVGAPELQSRGVMGFWAFLTACLLGILHPALILSQELGPEVYRGAEQLAVVTPHVFTGDFSRLPQASPWQPGDPVIEKSKHTFPPRLTPDKEFSPDLSRHTPDPLAHLQKDVEMRTFGESGEVITHFPGQGFTGVQPPDPVGDVGTRYYIQGINSPNGARIAAYDKMTGAPAGGPVNLSQFGTGNCATGRGDPIVLYDSFAERWFLSEIGGSGNTLCIYISITESPFQGFYNYVLQTPSFPDYPKYAVWPDAYYVSTNEGGIGATPAVYALERSQMLLGLPATVQRFTAPDLGAFGFQALTPADHEGMQLPPDGSPAYFMRHRDDEAHNPGSNDPTQDFLEIWEFSVDFANAANSTFSGPTNIPIAEFDSELCGFVSFSCFPQPNSNVRLDPLREVIMWRLSYRRWSDITEVLVGNFVTDVDGTDRGGVRWFQLVRYFGGAWKVFDEGVYSSATENRWMGSVALDKVGNFTLLCSISNSTDTFPTLAAAARASLTDPRGTLPVDDGFVGIGAAPNPSIRYGDYNSLNIDPVDDCTFWATGEYNPSTQWATYVTAYKFHNCQ